MRVWVMGFAAAVVLGGGVWAAAGRDDGPARPQPPAAAQRFLTRPDLTPPKLTVTQPAKGTRPGLLFLAPKGKKGEFGPMIADDAGRLVWFKPVPKGVNATDFRVQRYRGKPVLTWWEGKTDPKGYGAGTFVIADGAYREIARVRAGNGLDGDLHEFRLTPRGTALITIYQRVPADLTAVGGPKHGEIMDSVIQEVEVATGKVRFQWRSRGHVPITESHAGPPKEHRFAYDYFHVNSVWLDRDGDYIVSARNTWAVYKISHRTGRIVWRLGGKRSDFRMGKGTRFAWQHDAQIRPDGTLTLFDNEATPKVGPHSRVIGLRLDERRRTASLVYAHEHPDGLLSIAEGNQQVLPGGGIFVGWGYIGRVSELDADGRLLLDLKMPKGVESYRAYRFDWHGRPARPPAVAARAEGAGTEVRASWNGATDVARWQVLAGDHPDTLEPAGESAPTGFETAIELKGEPAYVAAEAHDAGGRVLGRSATVKPR
jgi:hypothetical protein